MMPRPKVRVFERKRVQGLRAIYRDPHEGTFVELSYETELRVGESENQGVRRALDELTAELTQKGGGAIRPDSLEERLRKAREGVS